MTTPASSAQPLVSLILPVRNEGDHMDRALDAIDAQTFPAQRLEVIVVDGGSIDGTLDIVRQRMAADPRISLLGGPGVNTPMAMRIGVAAAHGSFVAKVDGHGWINPDFVRVAVDVLAEHDDVGCVGGLIRPVASTATQRAIAIARFSRLGVGGGVYTLPERVQVTDTVQCGVYRRAALDTAGGFDPKMAYGEDEELNYRVRQAGWRIMIHPAMRFAYHVRPTIGSLLRQYFRYGRARVAVVRKHPRFLRIKHSVPAALVLALALTPIFALALGAPILAAAVWGGYLGLILLGAGWLSARNRFVRFDLLAISLAALHVGYGSGILRGLLDSNTRADSLEPRVEGRQ